jgi:hypothetical protein
MRLRIMPSSFRHFRISNSIGRVSVFQTEGWEFEPPLMHHARLAQLIRASRLHREGRRFESFNEYHARMVELAYTHDLGSCSERKLGVRVSLRVPICRARDQNGYGVVRKITICRFESCRALHFV